MDKNVIHSVFETVAVQHREKVAIACEKGTTTYADLNVYANRIAHLLYSIGCREGSIVNVIVPSSMELVASLLGTFKAGAIYLPVDTDFSKKRLEQIFQTTCNGYIIVGREQLATTVEVISNFVLDTCYIITVGYEAELALFKLLDGKLITQALIEEDNWVCNMNIIVNGESSNYIFYTSGSTGEAKAIVGRHVSLSHFIHWELRNLELIIHFVSVSYLK